MNAERYNQIIALMNEAIALAPACNKEAARQWFQTKRNMAENGMIDVKAVSACMAMAHSADGAFFALDKMQNNLTLFMASVKVIEDQRPQTCDDRVVAEKRREVLDGLIQMHTITHTIRRAVEKVYSTNSRACVNA